MSYSIDTIAAAAPGASAVAGEGAWIARVRERMLALRRVRPELAALVALAGVLNLWALGRNGWANEYYAAAVRSMSTSWHDFLFASLDHSGVMTVDKPPLALWVEALSVRIFGYSSLSIFVPQALMGMAGVVLVYDLVRRRFGRLGGFAGGLALALTPITVAISRHNNPDALLVLCSVAALWCVVRGFDASRARAQTRWLALAGVCVGLGFETKMGVALTVVPGITAAWLWLAPAGRGRLHALRQLLLGGGAMVLVAGAWPLLVELTPAGDRPWISGTGDNRVLSLIFEYNGLGRVDGQAGGPGGIASNTFGGSIGPLRLLNSALGGQAGWLLGFALLSGLAILLATRLRRSDERSGWLIVVGGAFALTAVLFSFASGIFHPYYVSLLAPFVAALFGAGVSQFISGAVRTRIVGPFAVAAGVAGELAVLGDYSGQLRWLVPLLIALGAAAAMALVVFDARRVRLVAVLGVAAALLVAPGVWAFDTLGHATSGTFPEGGPADVQSAGGPGGPGGRGGGLGLPIGGGGFGVGGTPQLFGSSSSSSSSSTQAAGNATGGPPGASGGPVGTGTGAGGFAGGSGHPGAAGRGGSAGGGPGAAGGFGSSISSRVLSYVKAHGGGTIAVSSQSSAASAIISADADVAGIGGFSGRESDPSVAWLAQEVRDGRIRWLLGGETSGVPSDGRAGAKAAIAAAERACVRVSLLTSSGSGSSGTLYDCRGRAAQLALLGAQESGS